MTGEKPIYDFCIVCWKKHKMPLGYNPKKHKPVCDERCALIERLFVELFSDNNQNARTMYEMWKKQTGAK